jgi:hypothetical protein
MPTELLYRIIDEPRGSSLRAWVVNPFWPWIALTIAGVWIGVPWFIFNSFAMGSPFRKKDTIISIAIPFAVAAGFIAMVMIAAQLGMGQGGVKYLILPTLVIKMIAAYVLFISQARAFQLHQQFNRPVKNAAIVAVLAFYLSERMAPELPLLLQLALM